MLKNNQQAHQQLMVYILHHHSFMQHGVMLPQAEQPAMFLPLPQLRQSLLRQALGLYGLRALQQAPKVGLLLLMVTAGMSRSVTMR
jgi:hypothetical protein